MSKKLDKHEAERLIAALDDVCSDDAVRFQRLRAASAIALARLVGGDAPWPELVDTAAATAGWSTERVRRLTDDSSDHREDSIDALYDLITELNETRGL
jgi:hypothetical protein